MTSYMYNPSGKITELLSRYLEFDPEQLKVGIWSGHLTLRNVHIRVAALAPLLQQYTSGTGSSIRIVSGTIGSLSLQIPWQSIAVWGRQGDVQLRVRDLVVTLETDRKKEDSSASSSAETTTTSEPFTPPAEGWVRDKKQKVLREAENRLLRHKTLGPWLQAVKRKEEEEQQQKTTQQQPVEESSMVKWLRSLSSDFLWRFWVGLQMEIENVKIIWVQEGVEIGLLVPQCKAVPSAKQLENKAVAAVVEGDSDGSNGTATLQNNPDPEDGEHVDKELELVGIGLYVRPVDLHQVMPADVYTRDYVLRPVDVALEFSLSFPLPSDKRKKRQKISDNDSVVDGTMDPLPVESAHVPSVKPRRGKRDKLATSEVASTEPTVPSTRASSGHAVTSPSSLLSSSPLGGAVPMSPRRMRMEQRGLTMQSPRSERAIRTNSGSRPQALPLAQPDDIEANYTTSRSLSFQARQKARFDGKLTVGAVQVVISSTHYRLIHLFLASSARIRNGRPSTTIRGSMGQFCESTTSLDRDESATDLGLSARGLNGPTISRTTVVRTWWRYVLNVVDSEIQQRRRLRRVFQQKYLSFNWYSQQYRRKEYVTLYIAVRLESTASANHCERRARLLDLEDKLPVEQVLLYRSIARSVHVRGGKRMPSSILRLARSETVQVSSLLPKHTSASTKLLSEDPPAGFLATLGNRCEVARARYQTDMDKDMPNFETFDATAFDLHSRGLEEEGSYNLDDSETKTVRTQRSHKSGVSCAGRALDQANQIEFDGGMLYEFSVSVQKLELMVVDDDEDDEEKTFAFGRGVGTTMEAVKNEQFASDTLSVLTDDNKFELIDESSTALEPSESHEQIYTSSDFLLFQVPERVIVRLVISGLTCATLGQSGGSRNVNVTIGRTDLTGERNVSLFSMGSEQHREAPLDEIKLALQDITYATPSPGPRNVLTLSMIGRAQSQFVQCDAPKMKAVLHLKTIQQVVSFMKQRDTLMPQPLLPPSPREDLRLYILQQNQTFLAGMNCSFRLHGCSLAIPFLSVESSGSIDHDVSERSVPSGDSMSLRCNMIEMYSGFAVQDLCNGMQNRMETEMLPRAHTKKAPRTLETRSLGMLDIPSLLLSNDLAMSTNWVRMLKCSPEKISLLFCRYFQRVE